MTRFGLCLVLSSFVAGMSQAATFRPGAPRLLEADVSSACTVPATFTVGNASKRVFFVSIASGVAIKPEGQPSRLVWARTQLKGGEQRPGGVILATNLGTMVSIDGAVVRYGSAARFSVISPFGWALEGDGLWDLGADGVFRRSSLPIAPWRNVTGFTPSVNYLYGANLLWVGTAPPFGYQRGLYQSVWVQNVSRPTYGIPDFQRVSAIAGVTGGYLMVYNGIVLRHMENNDPFALLYVDTGLPVDAYNLQSLRLGPNSVDAVAFVGKTLWVNLVDGAPTSVFLPAAIRHVAVDAGRSELIVSTAAGLYAVPYTLGL